MNTITQTAPVQTSYIYDFRELFWVDENISKDIITKQNEIFGFSLFLLQSKSIYEALKIGFLNSRNIFEMTRSIFSIPHTYIFGGLALGFFLQARWITYLFLPIFITILFLSTIPIFRVIHKKVLLYKQSRIFFNIEIEQAERIKKEFLKLAPYVPRKMLWNTKWWGNIDGNSTSWKAFMYMFSQPFIFGHLHLFAGIPFFDLIIFDFLIFCILFWIFEKWVFLGFVGFYSAYFYLFDHYPRFFSREDQERDFYMDLYRSGNQLLISIDALEKDMTDAKNGIIPSTLWVNLSDTIREIESLYDLIDSHASFLEWKEKFQKFLIGLLNEILTIYSYVFDFLSERILSIESDIDITGMDEKQKAYLLDIVKPILDAKKNQLQTMKEALLNKRI